jgi:HAD superfamily hydrolase (TIGR01509 family)
MQKLHGVLLDVDGTLVDSNDAHANAWVKALAKNGITVPFASVRSLIGKGGDKLLPEVSGIRVESNQGKAISRDRKEIFLKEFLPTLRPFPGVKELLARMKTDGLKLAIASSAEDEELDALLKISGADEFVETRTSSDDAENSKPDPDIIAAALKKIALSANQVILLGDTPYDIEAAARTSVGTVALRCGGWRDEELGGALAIYDDVDDVLHHYADSPFHPSATSSKNRRPVHER